MSDFSRPPQEELAANLRQGYVGMYFEQGVPILDRDLNLLQDLIATAVRSIVTRYIGDGVPAGRQGFKIQAIPADNDFRVLAGDQPPGTCLVGGIEVFIGADVRYGAQPGVPPLTTPTTAQGNPRVDTVYLDVFLACVDGATDDRLLNAGDVGVQTSVRLRPSWTVRVAENATEPPAPAQGHAHYALAQLRRGTNVAQIRADMIIDLRQTRLNLDHAERRISMIESLVVMPRLRPSPNQFNPSNIGPGGEVTIFGRNLDLEPVTVHFGAFAATPEDVAPNQIKVRAPADASGRVPVTVTTAGGTVTSEDQLTIREGGPAPQFADPPNEFTPKVGGAGAAVTLFGSNFNLAPVSVEFGTVPATDVHPSPNQIAVSVPPGVTQAVNITVTTRTGSVTSHDTFRGGAPPAFAATEPIKPTRGGIGAKVTLSGTNFDIEPIAVMFGTVPAREVVSFTATTIETKVPVGAPSRCKITVSTGVGAVVSTQDFNVVGGG
ncbi:IPT/TIG domain-containing protein [Actinomadura sp. NPDC047616]|uniref:IPT/TIG domain-containing protein n=1 Tax=Actinomadura sp. NPDC047616 TaxID=3155914 RepID=UPI0033DCB768